MPIGIPLLNQFQLPDTSPFLDPLFTGDGGFHRGVVLKPDQPIDAVVLREPGNLVVLMVSDPRTEIRRYTCVQRAVPPAGQDVHRGLLHPGNRSPDTGRTGSTQSREEALGFRRDDGTGFAPG
jgi:hypothetical protein